MNKIAEINARVKELKAQQQQEDMKKPWYGKTEKQLREEIEKTFEELEPYSYNTDIHGLKINVFQIQDTGKQSVEIISENKDLRQWSLQKLRNVYADIDKILDDIHQRITQ